MNINSQSSIYPSQPDNPNDSERELLARYALQLKGWPEDYEIIKAAMSPPKDIQNIAEAGSIKGISVGIIGAGLAGLSAAYELRKMGFDISLFEALENRIGGRVYTYYFDQTHYNELGAMRIPVIHEAVWHYINLFHLPTTPFIQNNPNTYIYLKNTRVRNDYEGKNVKTFIYPKYNLSEWENEISWQQLFSLGIESHLRNASPEERIEIIRTKLSYSPRTRIWAENINLRMLQASGLNQSAADMVSHFQPLLNGNLYNSYIDYVQEDYPANLSYLYKIRGGMSKLPEAFYNSFYKDNPYHGEARNHIGRITFHSGCWADGISFDKPRGKVILTYRNKNKSERKEFDYLLCTIPFSTLRSLRIDPLFSEKKMRAIQELNYIASQKSLIYCRERFWENEGIIGGGSFTDLPIASIWYPSDHSESRQNRLDKTSVNPMKEPGVLIGSYNFTLDTTRLTNQPMQGLFKDIKNQISEVHGLRPGTLDRIATGFKSINWNHEPTFRGALSFYSAEQKELFSYGITLPEYEGRVFFAGEHISAIHRWMQGALQTGMQAANDLVKSAITKAEL